jgi:hypothetical protein
MILNGDFDSCGNDDDNDGAGAPLSVFLVVVDGTFFIIAEGTAFGFVVAVNASFDFVVVAVVVVAFFTPSDPPATTTWSLMIDVLIDNNATTSNESKNDLWSVLRLDNDDLVGTADNSVYVNINSIFFIISAVFVLVVV